MTDGTEYSYVGCTESVSHFYSLTVAVSILVFFLLIKFVDLLISSSTDSETVPTESPYQGNELKNGLKKNTVNERERRARLSRFRFRNTVISFLHSLVMGTWAVINVTTHPEVWHDPVGVCTKSFYLFTTVVLGYFIYDTYDLLKNVGGRETAEVLPHHLVLIVLYSLGLSERLYLGYAVISMLAEVNSIFLHARFLLKIKGVAQTNCMYRAVLLVNFLSFLVFRFGLFAWMGWWHSHNYYRVPAFLNFAGGIGLLAMVITNAILFHRLVTSDILKILKKKD